MTVSVRTDASQLCEVVGTVGQTLLETGLPYRELSLLASASRRAKDPAYSIHKWWARRPAAVFRGLILAGLLPSGTSSADFWELYASDEPTLRGKTILDPFAGGGTTLVEAARLGARAVGYDVDPLAVEITRQSLDLPTRASFEKASRELLDHVRDVTGDLYPADEWQGSPLHYFYASRVGCPECSESSLLYRNLVLARDLEKTGAVVRSAPLTVFCPECLAVHELTSASQKTFHCCGSRHEVWKGTYWHAGFHCPHCGERATHQELKTGTCQSVLVGVESTHPDYYRYIRTSNEKDARAIVKAARALEAAGDSLWLPALPIAPNRTDNRPLSFGFEDHTQLYRSRQLLVLGTAFQWLEDAELEEPVRRALRLSLSNAITSNNRLCSYAMDYGRLAPLFSVRGYALPSLSVEINPLLAKGGRGTLAACFRRTSRALAESVRRYVWCTESEKAVSRDVRLNGNIGPSSVRKHSVSRKLPDNRVDLCVFDPPYFNYINYSELSEIYRVWLDSPDLAGAPMLPKGKSPVESFAAQFARCMQHMQARLKASAPLAFTFHSNQPDAWKSVGLAIHKAGMCVTALWPIRSDIDMGHHSMEGNCEYDIVVVCRPADQCVATPLSVRVEEWVRGLRPMRVKAADRESMAHAIEVVRPISGQMTTQGESR